MGTAAAQITNNLLCKPTTTLLAVHLVLLATVLAATVVAVWLVAVAPKVLSVMPSAVVEPPLLAT